MSRRPAFARSTAIRSLLARPEKLPVRQCFSVEAREAVGEAPLAVDQGWHRVPGVPLHGRRGRMVTGHAQHVRVQGEQLRQRRVHGLDDRPSSRSCRPSRHVRALHVQEEEVVVVPLRARPRSVGRPPPGTNRSMPASCATPRYIGYAAIAAARSWKRSGGWKCGRAENPRASAAFAGCSFFSTSAARCMNALMMRAVSRSPRRARARARPGSPCLPCAGRRPRPRRPPGPRSTATKRGGPCPARGSRPRPRSATPFSLSIATSFAHVSLGMRPARRSVTMPSAPSVQKFARRDVAGLELHAGAERLEHAAADGGLDRVVAEEAEVSRAAARRDARLHGQQAAERARRRERVEVRRARASKRRLPLVLGVRQVAEAVRRRAARSWWCSE